MAWAVYVQPMKGCEAGVRVICPQAEWEKLDAARPGFFTLVEGNLANEGVAERLARGQAGAARPRIVRPKTVRRLPTGETTVLETPAAEKVPDTIPVAAATE